MSGPHAQAVHGQPAARAWGRLAALAAAALAGCSGPAERPPPYQEAAALEARSGQEAYLLGRFGDAITSLREAVRLRLAAGDLPGAARSQLNLALAERASASAAAASAEADRLREMTQGAVQQLGERGGAGAGAAAELEAASGWLDGLLALDAGDLDRAQALAPRAQPEVSPQMRSRIGTLQAAIALRGGRFSEAVALAAGAREAGEAAHDLPEVAHAWGLEGEGDAGMGSWLRARDACLAAVAIEERIGGGGRMAVDLRELALICGHLGRGADARLYTLRADEIMSAGAGR